MRTETDYRALLLIVLCIALVTSCASIIITLGGVIGFEIAPDQSLSTLPVSLFSVGVALATIPASGIMHRYGRRVGFLVGASLVVIGGLASTLGIYWRDFNIFCLGATLIGMAGGFGQLYRYAAAELAKPEDRPKVISWVLTGGIGAAVIGPQTVFWLRDALPNVPDGAPFLAGSFYGLAVMGLIVMIGFAPPEKRDTSKAKVSIWKLVSKPVILTAMICGAIAYGLMALVMTAAPVSMEHHHHLPKSDAVLAIQWHVLAMFLPSFFTGSLIVRFGYAKIIGIGMVILIGAALVALSGVLVPHYWISLILLGLGWNFGFVGSTSLLADNNQGETKTLIEGFNDFVVFTTTAVASILAGVLLSAYGWEAVNYVVFPAAAFALLLLPLVLKRKA